MTDLIPHLSVADFDSAREFIKAVLLAKNPQLDLTPGSALDALLVTPEAYTAAAHLARYEQLSLSGSLAAITAGLVDVDDAGVDALISNYFMTRRDATNAGGPVRIVVDTPVPYVLPEGFRLTTDAGQVFVTDQIVRAFPPGSVSLTEGHRRMTARPDGLYEFTVLVVAEAAGTVGRLIGGTALQIEAPLAGMVSASVATDFTGGASRETNEELLARAAAGITAKVLAGPAHISATLAAEFPGCRVAVVGAGHNLQRRDRDNVFLVSAGGKQDLWVRTSDAPRRKTVRLTGTVVNAAAKRILLDIPRAESAGCYRVEAIRLAGAVQLGGDTPESVSVAIDQEELYRPTLPTADDARFSVYARLSCLFIETTVDVLTVNQVRSYDVDLLHMPNLAAVHAYVVDVDRRPAGQDLLVRAGVPCSVAVQATVRLPAFTAAPDLTALKLAIVEAINALPFGTASLSAFVVHRAIAGLLPRGDVVDTGLRGTILTPAGTNLVLPTSRDLVLPERIDLLTSPANTFFAVTIEQVELTLVSR